ncbi:hypothetical protein VOLCADRAFT_106552 [Volvox carteri f. nagariensis]|uniref:Pherophorin domain-containing protein n=1 Tax=Volvox carteri f. nagariensis TaxID=3068 RepID=D8U846_VOLCA|nr:uncharacterized protein VOLCADRAFT_106552 [Volvox carteri f. nagariensis]EFJ44025.1 hypothetical protein VOLCADRAFT_106552 [Volvox carteri f. nagariensis]|eukprot:XP_002954826.1 hypothetical protein VOLCADRAFT_106552 [Volvox carteri f. nagariensis]
MCIIFLQPSLPNTMPTSTTTTTTTVVTAFHISSTILISTPNKYAFFTATCIPAPIQPSTSASFQPSTSFTFPAPVTHAINLTTLTAGARASCIKTPKPAITHCIKTTIPRTPKAPKPVSPPPPSPGGNSILANDFPFLDCKGSTATSPYRMSSLSGPFNVTSFTATYCFTAALSSSPVPDSSCSSTTVDKIAFILVASPTGCTQHSFPSWSATFGVEYRKKSWG